MQPIFFEFDYRASNEGYWNYDQMVLQLEDCMDVLKWLYQHYEFLFYLTIPAVIINKNQMG